MVLTDQFLEDVYTRIVNVKNKLAGSTAPVTMPAITTYDGMLEAIADEAEQTVVEAAKYKGHGHDTVENIYSLTLPPQLYEWGGVKKVGGRSVVWNQLITFSSTTKTSNDVTYTFNGDDMTVTCSGTATGYAAVNTSYTAMAGHKTFFKGSPAGGSMSTYSTRVSASTSVQDTGNGAIVTEGSGGTKYLIFIVRSGIVSDGIVFKPMVCDLTAMFGAGNEPTLEEFNAMFPNEQYPYNAGELKSAGVTKINNYAIPADVQAKTGYGWSCPGACNYIDFVDKKYVQEVGSRAYASGDEDDATVITDKTTTHYKLTTPVETTISVDDPVPNAGPGDTITFENNLGDGYKIPVPVLVEYVGR